MWLAHIQEVCDNRKRGARKAAETRKAKRAAKQQVEPRHIDNSKEVYLCHVCDTQWKAETTAIQDWIGCDNCNKWFHWACVGIQTEPDSYLCTDCV